MFKLHLLEFLINYTLDLQLLMSSRLLLGSVLNDAYLTNTLKYKTRGTLRVYIILEHGAAAAYLSYL